MLKVAITTMTYDANYGNALQNYSVIKLIEQCGYEADTLSITTKNGYYSQAYKEEPLKKKLRISYMVNWLRVRLKNYCGAKNDEDYRLTSIFNAKKRIGLWKNAVAKKQKVFLEFQKNELRYTSFDVSNKNYNIPQLQKYKAFVTGSDQVWNPQYRTNSCVEFLQMVPREKRIAFVPSFGVASIPDSRKDDYSNWLKEIPYLSVRESSGAEIIKELTGREASVFLDPTFGLTKEQWVEFSRIPVAFETNAEPYVLCYFLGNRTRAYTKYIKQFAKKNHYRIIDVFDIKQLENYSNGPREFVWLINHAKAVFTDSFHGCALSINLQKPFVAFSRKGDGCAAQSSRLETLFKKLSLEKRVFGSLPINQIENIDYFAIDSALSNERELMIDYLRSALEKASSSPVPINYVEDDRNLLPSVSLIVPFHNMAHLCDRFFESLLEQNYSNIQVIIVNDGSTDDSEKKIEYYRPLLEKKGLSVKYLFQQNKGLGGAINTGLKHITGKYLCWADPDDYFTNDSFKVRVEYMESHPECMALDGDAIELKYDDKNYRNLISTHFKKNNDRDQFINLLTYDCNFCSGCHLLRTSALKTVNPTLDIYEARRGQNWQLLLPMYQKYERHFIDVPVYCYVEYPQSMNNSHKTYSEYLERYFENYSIQSETVNRMIINNEEKAYYLGIIEAQTERLYMYAAMNFGKRKEFFRYFKKIKKSGNAVFKDYLRLVRVIL